MPHWARTSQHGLPFSRDEAVPRHDVRLPDERSRLGADQGHARVARARRGDDAGRGRRPRVQHVHDSREARHAPCGLSRQRRLRASASSPMSSSPSAAATRKRSASGSSSSIRSSTSHSAPDPSRISATGSRPAASPSSGADSAPTTTSPPIFRSAASGASRPGCRFRWGATPRARTASSRRSEGASRAAAQARSSRRSTRLADERSARDHAARTERQLLGTRPCSRHPDRVRRTPPRVRRGRRDRPDPLHEPAPEGLPRSGGRRARRVSERLRARPPSGAVGFVAHPQGDAPNLRSARYLRLVETLREAVPDLALGTDLIVGFPGESDADFEETLSLVEEVRFDSAFTFIYSPRAGTEAAALPNQVPDDVKHERLETLVERVQRIAAERNLERVGRVEEVLVEGPSRTDPALLRGRTRRNTTVNFAGVGAAGRPRRRSHRDRRRPRRSAGECVARRGLRAIAVCTLSTRFVTHPYGFPRYDRSGWWAGVPHRS